MSTVNYQALVRVCSLSVVALAVSLHSGGALSAEAVELKRKNRSVSYTHLTLPTICSV